jgi:hypothetical protein
MMLPTDMALIEDKEFLPWVKKCESGLFPALRVPAGALPRRTIISQPQYADLCLCPDAEDREAFYNDFAKVFAKLIELGVERDGKVCLLATRLSDRTLRALRHARSTRARRRSRRRRETRRRRRPSRRCEGGLASPSFRAVFPLSSSLRAECATVTLAK